MSAPEIEQTLSLFGTIVEIDDHGNTVIYLYIVPFTECGWKLEDTLEATFATGQKIQIKFVKNYGNVPERNIWDGFRPLLNSSRLRLTREISLKI